jgi:hypothetical protein
MRAVFEEKMHTSNSLIREEYKAVALARRLQEQNEYVWSQTSRVFNSSQKLSSQILDLLLVINDAARIPSYLRFDLRSPSPSQSAVPSLEPDDEANPETIQNLLREARVELAAGQLSPEEFAQMEAKLSTKAPAVGPRTLIHLQNKTPHTSQPPEPLPDDLQIGDNAPGYLSPNHEEEYLLAADAALTDPLVYDPSSRDGRPLRIATQPLPTDKELTLRNPDSVYNWLRKHQPQVFLQDKDPHHENASEKSSARPAAAPHGHQGRGGGKRPSAVSTSTPGPKMEQDMLDDEIGFIPETGTGSAKARRNKDDEPYRPKGGSSRPAKRKREDGESGKGGRKKSRVSGGAGGSGGVS